MHKVIIVIFAVFFGVAAGVVAARPDMLNATWWMSERRQKQTYLHYLVKAEKGDAVARTQGEAFASKWLDKEGIAEVHGAIGAEYLMGGHGKLPLNAAKGVRWLRRAADAGNLHAMRALIQLHMTRKLLLPGDALMRYAEGVAESGDAAAQTYAAYLYLQGEGIPRNTQRAYHWASLAAEREHPGGMKLLHEMQRRGIGVPANLVQARKLKEKMQEAGIDATSARSMGSAFSPAPGMFVTNHHVIDGCEVLEGEYRNIRFPLSVVAITEDQDLALLRTGDAKAAAVGTIPIAPNYAMKRGEPLYAAGYSGGMLAIKQASVLSPHERQNLTMHAGTGDERTVTYDFILFTASVGHGDSGGPIVDTTGKVVAVTNAAAWRMDGKKREIIAGMGIVLGELRALIAPHLTAYSLKNFSKPEKLSETNRKRLMKATIRVWCRI